MSKKRYPYKSLLKILKYMLTDDLNDLSPEERGDRLETHQKEIAKFRNWASLK